MPVAIASSRRSALLAAQSVLRGHSPRHRDASADRWQLRASSDEIAVDLRLVPARPPVLNGVNGLSQKSSEAGNASYYYSITRLTTEGRLKISGDEYIVSGLSWLDREWSSSALSSNQVGWDWFALQLSDGSDLMFYNIRQDRSDVVISVEDSWDSPAGGRYPSRWTLTLPGESIRLRVTPVVSDQELLTTVRYWEGAVDVQGDLDGKPVSGRGYVELTGYAD